MTKRTPPPVQWRLADMMRRRGIGSVGELHRRLASAGHHISSSHLYRVYHQPNPEALSTRLLLTLALILECSLDDLLRFPPGTGVSAPEPPPARASLNDRVRQVPFASFLEVIPKQKEAPL